MDNNLGFNFARDVDFLANTMYNIRIKSTSGNIALFLFSNLFFEVLPSHKYLTI